MGSVSGYVLLKKSWEVEFLRFGGDFSCLRRTRGNAIIASKATARRIEMEIPALAPDERLLEWALAAVSALALFVEELVGFVISVVVDDSVGVVLIDVIRLFVDDRVVLEGTELCELVVDTGRGPDVGSDVDGSIGTLLGAEEIVG